MDFQTTKTKLENAIRNGEGKMSKEEMQKLTTYYSDFIKNNQATKDTQDEVGLFQGAVRSIVNVPRSALSSVEALAHQTAALGGAIVGNQDFAQRQSQKADKIISEGVGDPNSFFGTARPIGADAIEAVNKGDIGAGEFLFKGGSAGLSAGLEMASYIPMPFAKGAGFFATLAKQGGTSSALLAGSQASKSVAEGDTLSEGAIKTALTGLGSLAGFGLLAGGGQLMGNWGAKALSSKMVVESSRAMKEVAEKVFNMMPERFQEMGLDLAKTMVAGGSKYKYRALENEYRAAHRDAVNSSIDAILPVALEKKDSLITKFGRKVGEGVGKIFNLKDKSYKALSEASEQIPGWKLADNSLSEIESSYGRFEPKTKMSSSEFNKLGTTDLSKVEMGGESTMQNFASKMRESIGFNGNAIPKTLGETMKLWENVMSHLPNAKPEEQTMIRGFASALYEDARTHLEAKKPALMTAWDTAYSQFKQASELYDSKIVNLIKGMGDADNYIEALSKGKLTIPQQKILKEAAQFDSKAVENIFVSSLLKEAKRGTPEEASALIRGFIDEKNFGTLIDPTTASALEDIAKVADEQFEGFISNMQKELGIKSTTVKPEKIDSIVKMKEDLDVRKYISESNYTGLVEKMSTIKDPEVLYSTLKSLSEPEQKILGITRFQNVLSDSSPAIKFNKDGTVDAEEYINAVKAVIDDVNSIKGGTKKKEILEMMYGKNSLDELNSLADSISTLDDLKNIKTDSLKNVLYGVVGLVHAQLGHPGGAIMNFGKMGLGHKSEKTVSEIIESTFAKGETNKRIKLGDLMKKLAPYMGIGTVKTGQSLTE